MWKKSLAMIAMLDICGGVYASEEIKRSEPAPVYRSSARGQFSLINRSGDEFNIVISLNPNQKPNEELGPKGLNLRVKNLEKGTPITSDPVEFNGTPLDETWRLLDEPDYAAKHMPEGVRVDVLPYHHILTPSECETTLSLVDKILVCEKGVGEKGEELPPRLKIVGDKIFLHTLIRGDGIVLSGGEDFPAKLIIYCLNNKQPVFLDGVIDFSGGDFDIKLYRIADVGAEAHMTTLVMESTTAPPTLVIKNGGLLQF